MSVCLLRRARLRLAACCLCVVVSASATCAITCDFEQGVGHNWEAVGGSIPGLTFSTTTGDDLFYADIGSGWYSVTSDNGQVYHAGEYFVSGNVAVCASELTDIGRITFAAPTSFCKVGYSSQHQFYLDAYNSFGALIATASGPINTKSHGDTGLQYLTVTSSDIAYVTMHDEGGYWLVDNVTVPEPGSLLALGGLLCLALRRRRRQI